MKYNITYKDNHGIIKGTLENRYTERNYTKDYSLELKLENIFFKGDTFDGLEIQNEKNYDKEQLNRFSFNELRTHGAKEVVKELTNCIIKLDLQLEFTHKKSLLPKKVNGILVIALGSYSSKEDPIFKYTFSVLNTEYKVAGYSFEELFDNLKETIKDNYLIKNCYGCNYSDYSPYGRGSFGDMLCLKNAKEKYLKINGKDGLLELMSNEKIIQVQETYLCSKFEFRKENIGYRG
ncbi:DUF6304 family protein [Tenacibaculum jejuense]|uniref:Uncharacterized protein n=1 Tax=Tenacibaculum jejuense TaxID=584609 RepID=A0A238U6R0_9FLAO|nr:DUF6304 family protein [Tenacibaculum jejuense]SNR14164.1 conserved protein of unknown function [Tenacibaculum jejuense]